MQTVKGCGKIFYADAKRGFRILGRKRKERREVYSFRTDR
jgi:hypothetical protein